MESKRIFLVDKWLREREKVRVRATALGARRRTQIYTGESSVKKDGRGKTQREKERGGEGTSGKQIFTLTIWKGARGER